jgi:exopolyphosphatase/guanosine-5'-triphosphate,3'-diphosphate pyrophosphatase
VSDAKSEDSSSKRPGKNVEHSGSKEAVSLGNQVPKRSRRRWRKRSKRPENDILANKTDHHASTADDRVDVFSHSYQQKSPEPPRLAGEGPESVLGSSKNSKRRRRRRGKSSPASSQTGSPRGSVVAASGEDAHRPVPENTVERAAGHADKNSSSRNDKRRNRRRVPVQKQDGMQSSSTQGQTVAVNPAGAKAKSNSDPRSSRRWGDAYAALDLGTNNCRLLVAVPQQPGRFKVVDAFSRIVRLGEGLAATGRLREDAMDRAVGALKICASKLESRKVKAVRLIATEACRRAENGGEFLDRVECQTGIKLEVIDRETEARLAVAGCSSLVDRKARGVVLFDIGGGSSELALLDLSKRKRHDLGPAMVAWTSLPLGVVTLSEKHGGGKVVTRAVFENMVGEVSAMLANFEGRDALKSVSEQGEIHLLGTSGTVTTLAGIHLNLPRYDRRQVDGTWMASNDVDKMIDRLVDMNFEQRAASPCIGPDRADLVLAGCAILVAIQRLWPCPRLRVADRGLREGLLTEMMNADNAWQRRPRYFRNNRT